MKRFFSAFKKSSSIAAKNRLKSVIISDRLDTSADESIDKIKKDVAAVLAKYAGGDSGSVKIMVKNYSSSHCCLEATVSIGTA